MIQLGGNFPTLENTYLVIECWNSVTNLKLTIKYNMIDDSGKIINPGTFELDPQSTDRSSRTAYKNIGAGTLISVHINAVGSFNVRRGQCFVTAYLVLGDPSGGSTKIFATLFSDYITSGNSLAYPGSPVLSSIDGPGYNFVFNPGSPGVGSNLSVLVPANARWKLRGFSSVLITNAAAVNRQFVLQLGSGIGNTIDLPTLDTQPLSTTRNYTYSLGLDSKVTINNISVTMLPDIYLNGGDVIKTTVSNLNAGDVISSVRLYLEEWIERVSTGGTGPGGSGGSSKGAS